MARDGSGVIVQLESHQFRPSGERRPDGYRAAGVLRQILSPTVEKATPIPTGEFGGLPSGVRLFHGDFEDLEVEREIARTHQFRRVAPVPIRRYEKRTAGERRSERGGEQEGIAGEIEAERTEPRGLGFDRGGGEKHFFVREHDVFVCSC